MRHTRKDESKYILQNHTSSLFRTFKQQKIFKMNEGSIKKQSSLVTGMLGVVFLQQWATF